MQCMNLLDLSFPDRSLGLKPYEKDALNGIYTLAAAARTRKYELTGIDTTDGEMDAFITLAAKLVLPLVHPDVGDKVGEMLRKRGVDV